MKKKISILILAFISCTMLMGASSYINIGLRKMMDVYGRFKEIHWSNGQITRPEDIGAGGYGTGSVFNLGGGTITGNLAVTGTQTTTGNRVFGTDTTTTIGDYHVIVIPGTGSNTVTNADIYALSGVSANGQIDTQFGNKVSAVTGSATDLTVTRLVVNESIVIPGRGLEYPTGSVTFRSMTGTMSVEAQNGNNVVLMVSGTGTALVSMPLGTGTPVLCMEKFLGTQTLTGTTTETIYWTRTIPANTLGTNGILEVRVVGSCTTGNGSARLFRLYYGEQLVYKNNITAANTTFRMTCGVWASGSTTAQQGLVPQYIYGYSAGGANPNYTIAVDSSMAQTLSATWDPNSATETVQMNITLYKY